MKTMRKILMAALALVMVLGMSVTVYASQIVTSATKISAPKTSTVWTNPADDADQVITATFSYAGEAELANLAAVPKDRGIVNVKSISKYTGENGKKYVKVVLDPIKNGKTTVTIYDKNKTKVKGTTTVTVKTWAEGITFGSTSSVKVDEDGAASVSVVANGKLNLGAAVSNADASSKTLKYKKTAGGKAISVDSKGNVSVAKNAAAGDEAVIKVYAADNANTYKEVTVKVASNTVKGSIAFMKESSSTKIAPGKLNKSNAIAMKSNDGSEYKTYQLVATNGTIPNSDLWFTSSNTAVATVDKNTGLIKAISAGKAVINVTSKTGAKVSAKINVTVTTDVEVLNLTTSREDILANNKDTATLKLSSNSAAGLKAAKYTITKDGVTTKSASIDSKGKFKAKASGTYTVTAKSGDVTSSVDIRAITPTTSITINGADIKKGAHTIARTSDGDFDYAISCTSNGDIKAVAWSSSNTNVATVEETEDGIIVKPVANGTAKITVKALDGTNKTASISVKVTTSAYAVTSDRVTVVDNGGQEINVVYVASKVKTADGVDTALDTSVTLASTVAAKTNADASNKTITYYNAEGTKVITKVTIKDEPVAVIAKSSAGVEYPVLIVKLMKDDIAKDFAMSYNNEFSTEIKVGDKVDTSVTVDVAADEEGFVATDLKAVTYKSSNTKIATVDASGNVVAKATGAVEITATFKNPYDASKNLVEKKTIKIGSKDSTIKAALDTTFASVLKEENRDWTGIKTTFNSKTAAFTFNVLDPKQNVTELKDTGLTPSAIAACLALDAKKMEIEYITVYDELGDVINSIDRETVLKDGLNASLRAIITEAIGENALLENWVGTNYKIVITTCDNVYPESGLRHEIEYTASVTMSDALQKELADINIKDAIENAVLPYGISSIDYNEATRTAVVNVVDPYRRFEEAKATRDDVVESLAGAFNSVSFVDYTITIPNTVTATSTVADEDGNKPVEVIKDILDSYTDKLAKNGIVTYADADGTVATAQVTYKIGNMTFTRDYSIVFAIDKDVFAETVEEAIDIHTESANTALKDQAVVDKLTPGSNVITVGILDETVTPFQVRNGDIKSVTKEFIKVAHIDTEAKEAKGTAMMDGKVITLTKDDYELSILFTLLQKFKVDTLKDMIGKTAYVKFPVKIGNTTVITSYTIKFEDRQVVVGPSDDNTSEPSQSAIADEAVVEEEITVEETTEEVTDETATEEINDEAVVEEVTEEVEAKVAEEETTEETEEVVETEE